MKSIYTLILFVLSATLVQAQDTFESATDAVTSMRLGWNLGNTLDSNSGSDTNMWIERWSSRTPADYEKAWGQVPTTQALMTMMHDAGINAIRVPVTWWPHMVKNWSTLTSTTWDRTKQPMTKYIDAKWMARVKETVDYVINTGMYCILNVHHDTGDANTAWLRASMSSYNNNRELYEYLWKCIAEEFKDYDEHLLFEGYNEMLDEKGSWCFASLNSTGNYNATEAADSYKAINSYAQSFVDVVRATGGNNAQRNLIVNTYGCCSGGGTWSTHLSDPLTKMARPTDNAQNHILFQIHYYPSFSTLSEGKSDVNSLISKLKSTLVKKGAPVIIGEWGVASDSKVSYDANRSVYLSWAEYFVQQAKKNGMGTFLWMGLSDGEARSVPKFNQSDLRDAIVRGYYGEGGYESFVGIDNATQSSSHCNIFNLKGNKVDGINQYGVYIIIGKKVAY